MEGKVVVKSGAQVSIATLSQWFPCELEFVEHCVDRALRKQLKHSRLGVT